MRTLFGLDRAAAISPQVIVEFFSVVTRAKAGKPALYTAAEAEMLVEDFLARFEILPITEEVARDAVRAAREYRMPIFDAQIWATARYWHVRTILTEDLPGRAAIEGVRYLNPLAATFSLAEIGL